MIILLTFYSSSYFQLMTALTEIIILLIGSKKRGSLTLPQSNLGLPLPRDCTMISVQDKHKAGGGIAEVF